jgi:hypothetical protein
MSKKIILSAGVVVAAIAVLLLRAAPVGLAWDYDFQADPACSTAQLTDCVKEFRIMDSDSGQAVLVVPAPQTTATIQVRRPYGVRNFCVIAVTDSGIESEPSNVVQTTGRPGKAANFRVQ